MLDKLQAICNKYEELSAKSEQPDFYADPQKAAKLLREKNDLEPIVEAFHAYNQAQQDMADAQELMADPEMKELCQETYAAAKALLNLLGCKKGEDFSSLTEKLNAYGLSKAAAECAVGEPTLLDIAKELSKPGRDPRDELPAPILRKDVLEMKDLKPGMILTGTVRNVIDFGVFVDIGVHQDGLVHISKLDTKRVERVEDVVAVGDAIVVKVTDIDQQGRINLSRRDAILALEAKRAEQAQQQ